MPVPTVCHLCLLVGLHGGMAAWLSQPDGSDSHFGGAAPLFYVSPSTHTHASAVTYCEQLSSYGVQWGLASIQSASESSQVRFYRQLHAPAPNVLCSAERAWAWSEPCAPLGERQVAQLLPDRAGWTGAVLQPNCSITGWTDHSNHRGNGAWAPQVSLA